LSFIGFAFGKHIFYDYPQASTSSSCSCCLADVKEYFKDDIKVASIGDLASDKVADDKLLLLFLFAAP